MFTHEDLLSELSKNVPLNAKLRVVHQAVRSRFEFIQRISIALYDKKSGTIRTFLASSGRDYPLEFYETRMEDVLSLQEIMRNGKSHVINDLAIFGKGEHQHTKNIRNGGTGPVIQRPSTSVDVSMGSFFLTPTRSIASMKKC